MPADIGKYAQREGERGVCVHASTQEINTYMRYVQQVAVVEG